MKSKIELLKILLSYIESKPKMVDGGLCISVVGLRFYGTYKRLSAAEEIKLIEIIEENDPLHRWENTSYFWKPFEKQPRIDFLKQLIKKLEEQEKLHGSEQN